MFIQHYRFDESLRERIDQVLVIEWCVISVDGSVMIRADQ
jgi:hypothetical protein